MSSDRRTQTPQPVKHPVNPNLTPHNLPYGPGVDRDSVLSAQRSFITGHKPSAFAGFMSRLGGAMDEKIRDFNIGSIHSSSPWRKNLFAPAWLSEVAGSLQRPGISAAQSDYRSRLEGVGTTPEEVEQAQGIERNSYVAMDNHNKSFQKKSAPAPSFVVVDFCDHLRKEAGVRSRGYQGGHDFKTTNQIAGARAIHNAKPPRTATAEEMRPHQQYGGYDWSNYRSDMGNDLSGTYGVSSGPGYMERINDGRNAVLARGGDLSAMGITPLQAAPSPSAPPAVGSAAYAPPVNGGALGSPDYAAAMQLRARGSEDYQAARRGEGYMGFRPDGSWGLVTPAMTSRPPQAPPPAPVEQTQAPPSTAPPSPPMVSQTGMSPFDSRTTGPGQFNNLPPAPVGFDGPASTPRQWDRSGSGARIAAGQDPFQGVSRPVADYDPFSVTTGPNQFTNLPPAPAGFEGPAIDFPGDSPFNITTGPNQYTGVPEAPAGFDPRNLLRSPWAGVDPRYQQPRPMNPWQSLYGLNA